MKMMSEDREKCTKDSRPVCKYASKCYQQNPEHLKKFKHPPKRDRAHSKHPPKKMIKLDESRTSKSPMREVDDSTEKNVLSLEKGASTITKSPSSPTSLSSEHNINPNHKVSPSPHKRKDGDLSTHNIPQDVPKFIKEMFLVEMPDDFHSFWEFCKTLPTKDGIKNVFKSVNLLMVGPFDVLLGTLPIRENHSDYLLHWRYFYDPPEFQTVLSSPGSSGFHLGYFRDSPSESPCFVASNEAEKGCKIIPVAENIFGAMLSYLETTKKKSPFTSIACQKIITPLKEWANKHNLTIETNTPLMKKRSCSVVAKTFHGAGILVPYNKKTELGYRQLIESDAKIKEIISQVIEAKNDAQKNSALTSLQPIITMANIATDECDFGTGLELGIDFFCTGEEIFHTSAKQLLTVAYSMLNRNEFGEIVKAHLDNRRKGSNLSCDNL